MIYILLWYYVFICALISVLLMFLCTLYWNCGALNLKILFYKKVNHLHVSFQAKFNNLFSFQVSVLKQIVYGAIFTGIILLYVNYESPELLEHRFGLLITVLLLTLIGAPLFSLVSYFFYMNT